MSARQVRVTPAVATVLQVFLDDVRQPRYGYELMCLTGFASGKIYPILARIQTAGWLQRQWEDVDPTQVGRPPRRWYLLTAEGVAAARYELAARHQRTAHRITPRENLGVLASAKDRLRLRSPGARQIQGGHA